MKRLLISASLALGLASGLFADTLVVSAVNGGAATGSSQLNFDNLTLGNGSPQSADSHVTVTFTGSAGAVIGASSGLYAPPVLSGGNGLGFGSPDQLDGVDATTYLTSGKNSELTFGFDSLQKYFGLLWGSVDNYNTLSFYNGVTLVGSITGTDITANANGNQGASGTYYVNINDTLGAGFDSVVATSTQYAFEIDNVAYDSRSHVPDSGATVALVGAALVGLAALRRKL